MKLQRKNLLNIQIFMMNICNFNTQGRVSSHGTGLWDTNRPVGSAAGHKVSRRRRCGTWSLPPLRKFWQKLRGWRLSKFSIERNRSRQVICQNKFFASAHLNFVPQVMIPNPQLQETPPKDFHFFYPKWHPLRGRGWGEYKFLFFFGGGGGEFFAKRFWDYQTPSGIL